MFFFSAKVREKVYETLSRRRGKEIAEQQQQQQQQHQSVMTSSSESGAGSNPSASTSSAARHSSIKGIRPRMLRNPEDPPSPPELPPPPQHAETDPASDPSCLYARVDMARKKRRGNNGSESTDSTPCSPTSPSAGLQQQQQQQQNNPTLVSPTRNLIQKFNSLAAAGPPSPWSPVQTPSPAPVAPQQQQQQEPLYATIGSKNRSQNASRFAARQQQQ